MSADQTDSCPAPPPPVPAQISDREELELTADSLLVKLNLLNTLIKHYN